ncbi:MAG: hypothetical protein ACRD4L_00980 [Pyrinomonadaceae bacterium]
MLQVRRPAFTGLTMLSRVEALVRYDLFFWRSLHYRFPPLFNFNLNEANLNEAL